MKVIHPIFIGFTMICALPTLAQENKAEEPDLNDKVAKAIEEFNQLKNEGKEGDNDVVVVISPPDGSVEAEPASQEPPAIEQTTPAEDKPLLVTGKPPIEESREPTPEVAEESTPELSPEEKQGLEVRVESIRNGSEKTAPGQVTLKASFPAKSMSSTPHGWVLEKSSQAPAYSKEVTLRPGTTISLSIQPHVLVPIADGANTFSVLEPGFQTNQGYRQSNTVSAILGNSVAQLDRDSLLLGNAISDLHQLLASLPKPEPQPEDIAKPKKP